MKIRIFSNFHSLGGYRDSQIEVELHPFPEGRRTLKTVKDIIAGSVRCDYVLLNGSSRELWMVTMMKWLLPFSRFRIIVMDMLLSKPDGLKSRIVSLVKRLLFKKVHMMILYFKDTSGYRKYYGIGMNKCRYVPFKINRPDIVFACPTSDGSYVFCGGKTRRDFKTLVEAVRGTAIPVKIATMDNSRMKESGSFMDEKNLPGNVEVIRLDGSPEAFIPMVGGSRLVVLPIHPDISGVGMGVYIMAMALKKCVIISAGPGTEDIVEHNLAVVVPPEDPASLREVIIKAYADAEYRKRYEDAGYEYASKLGGEERLAASVGALVSEDCKGRKRIGKRVPGAGTIDCRS